MLEWRYAALAYGTFRGIYMDPYRVQLPAPNSPLYLQRPATWVTNYMRY